METTGDPSESIKRFGLTEIYAPTGRALVDVVFVHGLDGHPYDTWAWVGEAAKTFWPSQLLPPILKEEEARILVYGYNADVTPPAADPVSSEEDKQHSSHCKLSQNYDGLTTDFRNGTPCHGCEMAEASDNFRSLKLLSLKSKDKLHNHAERLLAELWAKRGQQKATERPIIFVTHSLGGLIVKRALIASSAIRGIKTNHLRSVYVSTYGILFLGTPHRGFDIESWISRWKPKHSSVDYPKYIDFRPQIIHSLGIKNETLENIDRQFIQLSNKVRMYFFYEGKRTNIHGKWVYVVEEESAVPLIQDVEHTSIQQDHTHMCQFENESSPGFVVVTEAIQRYAAEAPKKIQAAWLSEREEHQLRTKAQVREWRGDELNHVESVDTSADRASDPSSASAFLDGKSRPVSRQERHYIVPRERVQHFVGREAQLRKISSHFETGSRQDRPQVLILHALGGQGKSQIAVEYCQRSRKQYAGIFWVNAGSEDLAKQSFARVATALSGNSSSEIRDGNTAVDLVRNHLEAWDQRWLLVFDNYDKPEEFPDVRKFIPKFGEGHIIFTSRRTQDLDRLGCLLEIPAMDVGEGVSLLLREHSHQDIEQHFTIASEIVDRLGGLPLAIDQAAAYLRYQRLPLQELDKFLTTYDRRRKEILSHIPSRFWEYGTLQIHGEEERKKALSAFTTWEMSLEQLKTDDSLSSNEMTHVLTLSAFLNPVRIEEWLFRHYSERHHYAKDCAMWEELLSAPDGESIDASDDGSFRGSDINSYQGSDNDPDQESDDASNPESNDKINDQNYDERFNSSLSDHASDTNSYDQKCERRWSSVNFSNVLSRFNDLSLIQSLKKDSEEAIFSLHPLIRDWLQLRGGKDSRQSMITESVAVLVASIESNKSQTLNLEQKTSLLAHIDACVLSDDHLTKAQHRLGHDIQNCGDARWLAWFYEHQGRDEVAEKLLRRISATQTKSLGMENVDTLKTMYSYGISLHNQGKLNEAARIQRQTVQLQKRLLGEEHESTLRSLQSLALTLLQQCKYNEAENIQRPLLQSYEKRLGKRDSYTLECSSVLAETLRAQGKLVEAEKMQRETMQLSEVVLGGQHRDTLKTKYALVLTLKDQGEYKEAESLGRAVLYLSGTILGKQHPNTLSVMQNLAKTLFHRKEDEVAIKLCREALHLRKKVSGKNHPSTLRSMHDLAWILSYDESSYDEAERLCRQALVLQKDSLGIEHPDTLSSMNLLGWILSKHESAYHEAEERLRQTLVLREKVLGSEARNTLSTMHNLGWILSRHESSYHEAEQILRETHQLREKVLGSEHPDTIRTMHRLGWLLSKHESSYHEAEQILHQTLLLRKKVLGSEHKSTIRTMRVLAKVSQLQGKCDDTEEISQQMSLGATVMKTASDNSLNIESSVEDASLPSQTESSRQRD